ncbi:hypothetical protein OEZ86_000664 [Tetradesmus obliquus]|nr:hypothetical protein OEZ86_000664 [Tetradesmus obliquus]
MPISVLTKAGDAWQPQLLDGIEEEPLPVSSVEQLTEWVAYRVIGPTGARSKVVKEEHAEAPAADGSKSREILVQQSVEVTRMQLHAQSPEWAAPCWKNACKQAVAAGVNLEQVLLGLDAGAEQLLARQEQLDGLLAAASATQQQLHAATMARLTAKLLNEAQSMRLQGALLAEGAAGMWDMLADSSSSRSSGLTGAALRGLMAALRTPVLSGEVQLPAACAVWHACMLAKPRERLVQLGVVQALLHIAVPEAAAELPVGDGSGAEDNSAAAALVQALQPFMLAVLHLEAVKDEVLQAKFLTAVTIMLLANCDYPIAADNSSIGAIPAFQQDAANDRTGSAGGSSSSRGGGQYCIEQKVNPHPPFRGVFRGAIHACGLLQPLLALSLHSRPETQALQRASCNGAATTVGQEGDTAGSAMQTVDDHEQQGSAAQGAVSALMGQVVAAACQLLVAVNMPLDPASCAHGRSSWWALELDKPSPPMLSDADQLGLRLLVDALGLPDSWQPCLALKALALSSCWSLAHADQAMHAHLQASGQRSIAAGPDAQRASVAAAVLENLTAATENTAMIYKAELRLKHAALLKQAGIKRVHRERQQRNSSRPGSPSPPAAAGAAITSGAALASKQQQQQQTLANPGSQAMSPQAGSAASAIMGFFEGGSSSNSPGRTSRLTVAANTACMVANMCTSARGPPKKLSHEDEKAGALLSRVSVLTSRPVVDVYRPDRSPAPSQRPATSAAHARSSFSEGVTPLVPAVASINAAAAGSSRDPTPRSGADAAAVFEGAAGQQQQQQQLAGGAPQDVKAAFMKWLQEEMPQALSSVQSSAACSPRPEAAGVLGQPGPGGLFAMQEQVLRGLTSMADLGSTTTEDTEEAEPSSRPSSAAGSSRRRAAGSPGVSGQHAAAAGGSRPQSPWAPAVVEYRQQPLGIDKPWQAANQLLVAAADEEVVQELAGAVTDLLGGRLPAHSPPSVLRSSMQRKAALDLQTEQLRPRPGVQSAPHVTWREEPDAQEAAAAAAASSHGGWHGLIVDCSSAGDEALGSQQLHDEDAQALLLLQRPNTDVPRPVTVLDVSGEVMARPVQVLVKGRADSTLPDKLFNFHSPDPPADPNLCMHVFEHCDGAQFCADLYGHYLLPNGKLAHIFLPPAAAKQGHCVSVPPPPATPWAAADWLPQDGLPAAPAAEVLAGWMQPGSAVLQLPLLRALNWVPVPQAPPQPAVCSLSATRDAATGALQLRPTPLSLKAVVEVTLEQREYRKPLPSKTGKRRTVSTIGALQQQQTAAPPKPAALPRIVSEHLQMKQYAGGQRFKNLEALNGAQSLACFLWAYVILLFQSRKEKSNSHLPPWTAYWRPALTNTIGPACGLIALKNISYPAQVLAKSCKMVPVMLIGTMFYGKRYSALEYMCMSMIGVGISLFARKSSSKVTSKLAAPNAPLGYLLCFINLTLDGYTNAYQDEVNRKYKDNNPIHMMCWMNFWCALFNGLYLAVSGVGQQLLLFLSMHTAAAWDVVLFCLCGAVGQLFIFFTIKQFGSLVNTLICTTRKFFNILGSVVLNANPLLPQQWWAVGLVFTGLITSSVAKGSKHHGAGKQHAGTKQQ